MSSKPGVLMVTGAYYPELSGAGLQCRALVRRLQDRVDFTVLTTTADRSLGTNDVQDGVPVHRVFIDPSSRRSKTAGAFRFARVFLRHSARFSIVHLHGFSQKSIWLMWLAHRTHKRVAIKLTSAGHDDPASMKRRGGFAYRAYAAADLYFAVSPRFVESYKAAGLPPPRLRLIPNGVDCDRFRPARAGERESIRRELGLPPEGQVVLFIGFFSREKRPDALFDAWAKLAATVARDSVLVFVGATQSTYYEVDRSMAERIANRARALGLDRRVRFVEATREIERFHRAASLFVLPSVREGLPNALLEAMASGIPCIATRIEGVTDTLITDGVNGLLVAPEDERALGSALQRVIQDAPLAARLGAEARRTVLERYALDDSAKRYFDAYVELARA